MKALVTTAAIIRLFAIGNIGFAYGDSTVYLYKMYGVNIACLGMLFLILSYYVLAYLIKTRQIEITVKEISNSYKFLKLLAIIIAIAPLLVHKANGTWVFDLSLHDMPRSFFEVLKIAGAEAAISVCIWVAKKLEQGKKS